ncbi:MAG: hypothetical protein CVV34_03530, partial [Methanomicrobiales archaeon HGW-Methanomicrobiales-5]
GLGEQFDYEIVVTNNGPSTAENVVTTDTLPAGVIFVNGVSTSGTVTETAGVVTADIGDLASGDVVTITLTVEAIAVGETTNTAVVDSTTSDVDTTDNTTTPPVTVDVFPVADLSVTKTASAPTALLGQPFTYTITITNNGPSTAVDVYTTDTLPSGVVYVSSTTTTGTVTANAGVVVASLGDIAVGDSETIVLTVSTTTTGLKNNRARVDSSTVDLDPSDNLTPQVPVLVIRAADLSITKTSPVSEIALGEQFTYTITVTNSGPSSATNTAITDTIPAGLTYVSSTTSQGSIFRVGNLVSAFPGTIVSGGVVTITITVRATAVGLTSNPASVTSLTADPNTGNNTTPPVLVDVVPASNLAVTKTASADEIGLGEQFTYTITVTNNGPSTAEDVFTTDTLPAGTTYVSGSASQGSVSESGNEVVADLGTIPAGDSVTITITVEASAVGSTINTATADSSTTDVDTNDNTNDPPVTVEVVAAADLNVTKTASVDEIELGEQFSYEIVVTNNGPSTAENVITTDTLPSGVTFVSGVSTSGTVTETSGVVTAE